MAEIHNQTTSALTIKSAVAMSSGYTMPSLGLGVYQNDDCKPACLAALECGYTHIDSARMYRNEEQVGEAVRESKVPREDVFITSKIYETGRGLQGVLSDIDESLSKFGFDYLDLYLIHSPIGGKENRLTTWKALLAAKKAGKIRTAGVSNYGPQHMQEILDAGLEMPAVNQVELHPFCQQKPIVDYCREHGIIVQAYTPLVRGALDNPVLQQIAKKYNKDPAQILIRWSLQHTFVPLPKSANPERVRSNAKVFDFEISKEDMQELDALDKGKAGAVTWNPVDAE
ncbi:Aldo/keto reductase [Artomyces pyxidatus]|uniref:Aldo/keto reductase n=1 Tax=Artomyces pyxidatus TaxID=48021 RepID=A0ACB8TJX9_9AGAM|nr:Aldo/keto reductase [Artomyces pyxidatus]